MPHMTPKKATTKKSPPQHNYHYGTFQTHVKMKLCQCESTSSLYLRLNSSSYSITQRPLPSREGKGDRTYMSTWEWIQWNCKTGTQVNTWHLTIHLPSKSKEPQDPGRQFWRAGKGWKEAQAGSPSRKYSSSQTSSFILSMMLMVWDTPVNQLLGYTCEPTPISFCGWFRAGSGLQPTAGLGFFAQQGQNSIN